MRVFILTILFSLLVFLGGAQPVSAAIVFDQSPINESLNGPILNSPYLLLFGCTGNLNWCGLHGKTVYNIGVWIKKVGNPADIRLQVVDTIWQYPASDSSDFSNAISASSVSNASYTFTWFHFPNGVVIGDNKLFLFQFSGANNTFDKFNYYQALYDPVNSYNAPQQYCKIYLGCWSSRFFWKMDDEKTDLSLPTPPPDPCIATNTCASNVLFLPGIEASRLYRPDYNGGTDQLWEPNIENDVKDLFLTEAGTSVREDVYTRDVLDEKNVLPLGQGNIYKSFLNDLKKWKDTDHLINDYAAVPYDWRLSFDEVLTNGHQFPDGRIYYAGSLAATSSPYIIQELRRLAASSKTGKVTIVAHSNGGLLTKALTDKLGSAEAAKLIDKIIFIAVPQVGAPQAVGAILHGYDQGLPFDSVPLILTPETARTLALNMPSAYNLLPSASYFTHVDDAAVTFDDSDILAGFRERYGAKIHDGTVLGDFITDSWRLASSSPGDLKYPSVGNPPLLAQAEALHSTVDAWAPPLGVSLYEVAGWGEDTLATIEYKKGKKASCRDMSDVRTCTVSPAIIYSPKDVVEGDGTVLVPSALWTASSATAAKYWVDLRKYNKFKLDFLATKHAEILEVLDLRILVKNILTNATSTPIYTFITTIQPATDAATDNRLRFLLHSPLNLSATDSLGNVVSSGTSTIPGARWKRYGEVQVVTVPENTSITLNLEGYAAGSFTLNIEEIDGSNTVIASSTLSAIPSTENTKASMVFGDGTLQGASPLLVDYDGNGVTDISLKSEIGKEVVFDTVPPEATLTFDPVSQTVVVIGTDNLSNTTVVTTAASSLITDDAGNTLEIVFTKFKQEGKQAKVEVQGLRYNGVPARETSKTVLQYEWSVDKTATLKELQQKVKIAESSVEGHYDTKKSVTRIGEKDLTGLVIIGLTTDAGKIHVNY